MIKKVVILLFVLVLGTVALFTVWRTSQPGPVAPTVPQAKPQASEPTVTPACTLSFTVAAPPATLKCDAVKMEPDDRGVSAPGTTRTLTVSGSGGINPLTYSWTATGGALSAASGQTVIWTAPASLGGAQNWTITATVTDANKQTATSDNCKVQLNYSSSCNSLCNSSADCPTDLACSSGRCRNTACVNQSDCKCLPSPKVCNETCLKTEECGSGLICAGGNCRNSACITQSSCVCSTPPVTPQTHRECRNNACVTVSGAGQNTCTSDVSCQPKAIPPQTPPSGVDLPTIATILGGVGLVILGLIVVF